MGVAGSVSATPTTLHSLNSSKGRFMFIKNEDGGVHSVADDFELPKGWTEISEEVARVTHPSLQ
jgi:hypothetical protein